MLLVGCGAAGAIAGIFKAPITGLVFVIEVLLMDLTLVSILPLLTTSVTSASLAYILTGRQAMFSFMQSEDFILDRIPYTLLLGILCGFVTLYFSRIMFFLERRFKRIPKYVNRFLLSAVILSVLIVLMPPLYGEGYSVIEQLLSNDYSSIMQGSLFAGLGDSYWWIVLFLTLVLLFKVFASVATNSGGGCGGSLLLRFCGRAYRLSLLAYPQLLPLYPSLSAREKFYPHGDGWDYGGRDARPSYRGIPYC